MYVIKQVCNLSPTILIVLDGPYRSYKAGYQTRNFYINYVFLFVCSISHFVLDCNLRTHHSFVKFNLDYVAVFQRIYSMFCKACAMCTGKTVDQSNCIQLACDIMCVLIGFQLLCCKILWIKHVVFWLIISTFPGNKDCVGTMCLRYLHFMETKRK